MNCSARMWGSLLLGLLAACSGESGPVPEAAGIFAPIGEIRPSASEEERATFLRGEAVARHRFTAAEGLGPHFNVTFCGACHEKPVFGGSAARYRNFLLVGQELPDGSRVELGVNGVLDQFDLRYGQRPTDEQANHFAGRNPIPFFGVGLLAEISEEAILANADPDDRDGDGISGRPNYDRGFVGRFGVKAQTVSIEGFIRGPLFNHAGITSAPLSSFSRVRLPVPSPTSVRSNVFGLVSSRDEVVQGNVQAQAAAPEEPIFDEDEIPDPELAEDDLFDLVSWAMLLAAPQPDEPTELSEHGRELFASAGCTGCHVPSLRGPRGMIPAYTDLLLHDMGPDLADGVQMKLAEGSEFRTQPLWGVVVSGPWLHDGRADSLDEAIRLHGGEAQGARDEYVAMGEVDQLALVAFLTSLGGAEQYTDGLLPPDAEFAAGELGGPRVEMPAAERAIFDEAQRLFDRDSLQAEGLGPVFNGDACRACHFEPVVGGAGPTDVNVIRQAIPGTEGPTVPDAGSILHRHALVPDRPRRAAGVEIIEPRQTPALFGLGLLEQVPEELIEAAADPMDLDGDGISGRVQRLPDGRLGRFGWKASVPSLAEFSRDAASMELGLTVPASDTLTYGLTSDDDGVPDPEIDAPTLDAITFYMAELAPPVPDSLPSDVGEQVFMAVGCGDCHGDLALADGTPVRAFTDLLLHDVAPLGYQGVPEFDANPREFRTPPLWGISETGPWMHDGLAFSLEESIARHAGEAEASRAAYEALSAEDRAALLEFLRSL